MDPTSKKLLLLAAEDANQCEELDLCLQAVGYRTKLTQSLPSFWRLINQEPPFAVLIFACLNSMFSQPWQLCRELAAYSYALRVLLVPENCPHMREEAFLNRADQCFSLPFNSDEIIAYLDTAQLRHIDSAVHLNRRQARETAVKIDLKNRRVYHGGRAIDLTAQECAVLNVLAHQQGQIVTYEELCQLLWPSRDAQIARANLKQYVMRLRRKLETPPNQRQYLQTVTGLGYRLELNVPGEAENESRETGI